MDFNASVIGSHINMVNGIQINNFSNDESDFGRVFGSLRSLNVPDAKYNSRNLRVPPCSPDTRSDILEKVKQWITEPHDHAVCWLHGMAGSGKSAIAQSISEFCARENKLAASFFFDRQEKFRCIPDSFVATIAYQLAATLPGLRRSICQVLSEDESILHGDLDTQLQKLVIDPLRSFPGSDFPSVIVIDALDECEDKLKVVQLLTKLADPTCHPHIPFRLFITSRPEPSIQALFETFATLKFNLQDFNPDSDIRSYIAKELNNIRRMRQFVITEPSWPSSSRLDLLVKKASGLFIYAATVVKFIGDERRNPQSQLEIILNMENGTESDAYSGLDSLYKQILLGFPDSSKHMYVLSTIILLQDPLSPRDIALLLSHQLEEVLLPLERLHSILFIPHDPSKGHVTVFHRSLYDFLTSRYRAGIYFVGPSLTHADLAKCCLEHITKTLPKFSVDNIESRQPLVDCRHAIQEHLNLGDRASHSLTRYACRHWASHLTRSPLTYHWTYRFTGIPLTRRDLRTYKMIYVFCTCYAVPWRLFLEIDTLYNGQNDIPDREQDKEWALEVKQISSLTSFLWRYMFQPGLVTLSLPVFVLLAGLLRIPAIKLFSLAIAALIITQAILFFYFPWGPVSFSRLVNVAQLRHHDVQRSFVQVKPRIDRMNLRVCTGFYMTFTERISKMVKVQLPQEAVNDAPDQRV